MNRYESRTVILFGVACLVVFFILAWFTMKFVWPPVMKALDDRAKKIADGLAAADKAKADVVAKALHITNIQASSRYTFSGEVLVVIGKDYRP